MEDIGNAARGTLQIDLYKEPFKQIQIRFLMAYNNVYIDDKQRLPN